MKTKIIWIKLNQLQNTNWKIQSNRWLNHFNRQSSNQTRSNQNIRYRHIWYMNTFVYFSYSFLLKFLCPVKFHRLHNCQLPDFATQHYDATMFHCEQTVFRVLFFQHIAFCMQTKKLNLYFILKVHLSLRVCCTPCMAFDKLQRRFYMGVLKQLRNLDNHS